MKCCLLLAAASALLCLSSASVVPTSATIKPANDGWMKKQLRVLGLLSWGRLKAPYEEEFFDWVIQHKASSFKKKDVFETFMKMFKEGFLPRDSTFSMYSPKARKESIVLFELFYYAKDFDSFYRAACWARKHVNYVNFVYAFSLAVYHRADCKGLVLPPLYQVVPNYFIPADVMHKAYDAKMHGEINWKTNVNVSGYDELYYHSKFGGMMKYWNEGDQVQEYRVSYLREDVSLNDLYARWHMHWPNWFNSHRYGLPEWHDRGQLFYYFHKQLLARYTLERFANCLPIVDILQWNRPIKAGYNPNLIDMKGNYMITRPDNVNIRDYFPYGVTMSLRNERFLGESTDARSFMAVNGTLLNYGPHDGDLTEMIGRGMLDTAYSIDGRGYKGSYYFDALKTLAYAVKTNTDKNFVSGATANLMTTLRDPAYFSFLQRMVKFVHQHKMTLPPYTIAELGCHGVKINSVEVDKLTTYFEPFEFDMSYGLSIGPREDKEKLHYSVTQPRLNRRPFNIKFRVTSEESTQAMVRVFIGPKYDSEGHKLTLEQARLAYFEMDRFPVELSEGLNEFARSSEESSVFVKDDLSARPFKAQVEQYAKSYPNIKETFRCGFPQNLQLPKGKPSGSPFVLFAIVTPYEEKYEGQDKERYFEAFVTCGGSKFYDFKAYGFPFDRPLHYDQELRIPNAYFKDILIHHEQDHDYSFKP